MTEREKLIELLKESDKAIIDEARPMTLEEREEAFSDTGYEFHADFLIANGVTVREKGEWVFDEVDGEDFFGQPTKVLLYCKCSECGRGNNKPTYSFCPQCGARMDGVK